MKFGRNDVIKDTPAKKKETGKRKNPPPKRNSKKLNIDSPTMPALPTAESVKKSATTNEIMARIEYFVSSFTLECHFVV